MLIERYIWRTILPYFLLAWLLLTAILFLQQGSRFTEILFGAAIPTRLLIELSLSLVVSVVAFTAPMALLTGIVVGLGQMRGDSEIVALQAAGIGLRRVMLPCLLLGIIVSGVAFVINLQGVPIAAGMARRVAVEAALVKLESPIEPGIFNTQFSNYVIYVREGNNEQGVWERVFIYLPEKDGGTKLITARAGRIDAAEDKSELVLSEAIVTTLPANSPENHQTPKKSSQKNITVENVNSLRVSLDTGRKQLKQRLESVERVPDEMGLEELSNFAQTKTGKERGEAQILWHRRLALSFAPFFLALLGAALSLRFGRGGRGWAIVLSLGTLIFYYLIHLLGEQTVRANLLPAAIGCWLATTAIFLLGAWCLRKAKLSTGKRFALPNFYRIFQRIFQKKSAQINSVQINSVMTQNERKFISGNLEAGIFGLLERDLLKNLLWYFALTCGALLLLFHVFTVFEVLRGLTATANGGSLLINYLLLLSPMVLWQIAPTALMIAVLVTYTLKARENEIVVWGAAGQSVYVLLLPCLILAALLGLISWEWQERLLPSTNPRQDVLRAQLRGGAGSVGTQEGRFWVAANEGIYSFVGKRSTDNATAREVTFYKFAPDLTHLAKIIAASAANWSAAQIELSNDAREVIWQKSFVEIKMGAENPSSIESGENPFNQIAAKPADLSSESLAKLLKASDSPTEERRLSVALQRKYSTLFLPLVMVFFAAPLALSLRRRGSAGRALGMALAVWLLFTAIVSVFDRLGTEGILPPAVAVWSPLILFSSLGWYLLAKTRN